MAQMTIREIDDDLYDKLKVRAARAGRSAEAEVREILKSVLRESDQPAASQEWLERVEAFTRTLPETTDSADLIREERDRRAGLID